MVEHYLTNKRSPRTPAEIKRKIIECELIDGYHWLPKEIDEIPYKRLQELFVILELKRDASEHNRNVEVAKNEAKSFATRGKGPRKTYREV